MEVNADVEIIAILRWDVEMIGDVKFRVVEIDTFGWGEYGFDG